MINNKTNSPTNQPLDVAIIGGGMITTDQLLPAIYQLQRTGIVNQITIANRHVSTLKELANNSDICNAFPGQSFNAIPTLDAPDDTFDPDAAIKALDTLKPRQAAILALPDQIHFPMVTEAIKRDQHVLCVKPLVRTFSEGQKINELAKSRGLFVGIEYHKRYDRRALLARKEYETNSLGEFKLGEARLIEPYYFRNTNFGNWFVCEETDPFTYVGCHYVDQVYFITGLKPSAVSLTGVKGTFPGGNEGYFWSNGRVIFENGAALSVSNGLGYPNAGPGANQQGITMYFDGPDQGCVLEHDDQNRGASYSFTTNKGPGGSVYNHINPDFFKYIAWDGKGFLPTGYGFDSVAANINAIYRIENQTRGMEERPAKARRLELIQHIDQQGFIATPSNSYINELVIEAARISILNDGTFVDIHYGDNPRVEMRTRPQ